MIKNENFESIKNVFQKIGISNTYKIIITTLFFLSTYAFMFLNPYNILNYIYFPFVFVFTIIGIYLIFTIDTDIDIQYFLYKLFYYVGIFILFAILYFFIKKVLLFTIGLSLWAVFLFYIIGFALIYKLVFENNDINTNKTDDVLNLIQYIIFYIPCILIDVLNYIINDAKNTNKTTYVLGFLLVVLMIIYFLIPYIQNYMYKLDGLMLIPNKRYLNESILTLTLKELKEKIDNTKSVFFREGFKSIHESELKDVIDSMNYKTTYSITQELSNSFLSKIYYYFINLRNKYFLSGDELSEEDLLIQYTSPLLHTYHYGISFWLYLDSNMLSEKNRNKALILTLGSRPSLYYDYNTRELIIEITDKTENTKFEQIRIYNSSALLFQKWNHIVMNYVNGQFDLFVNNEIVCAQSNVSPYVNNSDVLQVGSIENTDLGGISNLKYYDQPLTLYKIKKIFNAKKNF